MKDGRVARENLVLEALAGFGLVVADGVKGSL